jgi:hypothetical protein
VIPRAPGAALWAALLVTGCGGDAAPVDQGTEEVAPAPAFTPAPSPASLAEIPPGDTGAILGLMRRVMTEGDGAAFTAEQRDTTLAPEPAQEPRRVTLLTRNDEPLKLIWTEPNDAGQMTGETQAWFVDGEVRVLQEPFAAFFLDGDRIVLWTDEALEPVPVPEADRMARESVITATLRARLALFGRDYP